MKLSALATAGGGGNSSGDGIYLAGNGLGNSSYSYTLGVTINTGINASAGLTQVLSLPGPGVIGYLRLAGIPNVSSAHAIRITIDGEIVTDANITATTPNFNLISGMTTTSAGILVKYDTSFVVEYNNPNATNMSVEYQALRTK